MLRDPKNSRSQGDREDAPWPERDRPHPPSPSGGTVTGYLPFKPQSPGSLGQAPSSSSRTGAIEDPSTIRDSHGPLMTRPMGSHLDIDDDPTVYQPRDVEPELDWADSESLTEVYRPRPPVRSAPEPV